MRTILHKIWKIITSPFRACVWVICGFAEGIRTFNHNVYAFFTEDEEDTPLGDTIEKAIEHPDEILVHIDALRKHLLRSTAAILITTSVALIFVRPILAFLAAPLEGGLYSLTAIDITENISAVMRVGLLAGFAIALPYTLLELFVFFAQALSIKSRIRLLLALPVALLLFLGGMAFTYYVMLPVTIPFLINFMGLQTNPRPSSYFSFVTNLLFWIGLFFELPIVAYLLADFGILRAKDLIAQSRIALVIIAILAAAITPTTDIMSMVIVMVPMSLLYIFSILLVMLAERNRRKRASEIT